VPSLPTTLSHASGACQTEFRNKRRVNNDDDDDGKEGNENELKLRRLNSLFEFTRHP